MWTTGLTASKNSCYYGLASRSSSPAIHWSPRHGPPTATSPTTPSTVWTQPDGQGRSVLLCADPTPADAVMCTAGLVITVAQGAAAAIGFLGSIIGAASSQGLTTPPLRRRPVLHRVRRCSMSRAGLEPRIGSGDSQHQLRRERARRPNSRRTGCERQSARRATQHGTRLLPTTAPCRRSDRTETFAMERNAQKRRSS